jgi:glycerol kinase
VTRRYVAAIDQGTTSTRCIVFDTAGRMVSVAQRLHGSHHPRPGWAEHDAAEIWRIVEEVLPRALAEAGIAADQVVALGVTNQRETTVVWDRRTGRPVHPAIVWQDTRNADLMETIAAESGSQRIQELSGLPSTTYFSGSRLRWLLEHVPGVADRAASGDLLFGTMDSWLVWNLTGGVDGGRHVTDATNASRTMLMNLETLQWDDDLLEIMHVPRAVLPEIVPSLGVLGATVGPVAGIPLAAVIGDQQASLFGQTAFDPGEAKCTFGTGSFVLLNTGTRPVRSRHGLVSTVAYQIDGEETVYALEGSIAVAGDLVRWCCDNLGLIRSPAEIETLALRAADNGGCYLVPAFSGLFAPHWESQAQGLVVGLTSYATKAHLARAVVEAVAWQTREVVDAMNSDADVPLTLLAVDGGMTGNNLLMQTVSDFIGVPVVRPMMAETVSLGAAYAAGLAVGYWPDRTVLRRNWHLAAQWEPTADRDGVEREFAAWRDAVALAVAWGRRRSRPPS